MSKHIRTLKKVIEKAAIPAQELEAAEVALTELEKMHGKTRVQMGSFTYDIEGDTVVLGESLERLLIKEALKAHNGNQTAAAEALGLSRDVLRYRTRKYQTRASA
jgi:transcriptional regulator with PAS, ATPase and Fis domain